MTHAELDMRPDRLKVYALNAHVAFVAKVKFTTDAELFRERMRIVHNQRMARTHDILAELQENLFKFGDFLVVLVDVQDDADFRFVTDKRSITFIDFGNEPFALAAHGIANLALRLQVHKTSSRHHGRLESSVFEDVVNHRGHRRFSARAANRNRARFLRNLREHFAAVHHRDAEFLRTLQIRIRIFNRGAHHHSSQAFDNARTILRKALDSAFFELAHDKRLFCFTAKVLAKLTVATANSNALAYQILRNGTHAHASNTDKKVRFHD